MRPQKQSNQSLPVSSKRNTDLLSVCSNGGDFIKKFNFDFCSDRYRSVETLRDAIGFKSLTLRDVSETYNQFTPELLLQAWLANLSVFMDFEITDQQAVETSKYMYRELKQLTLPLLTLFFQYLKMGKYGPFYGKFNGQKILIACAEFRKEISRENMKIANEQNIARINKLYER